MSTVCQGWRLIVDTWPIGEKHVNISCLHGQTHVYNFTHLLWMRKKSPKRLVKLVKDYLLMSSFLLPSTPLYSQYSTAESLNVNTCIHTVQKVSVPCCNWQIRNRCEVCFYLILLFVCSWFSRCLVILVCCLPHHWGILLKRMHCPFQTINLPDLSNNASPMAFFTAFLLCFIELVCPFCP